MELAQNGISCITEYTGFIHTRVQSYCRYRYLGTYITAAISAAIAFADATSITYYARRRRPSLSFRLNTDYIHDTVQ